MMTREKKAPTIGRSVLTAALALLAVATGMGASPIALPPDRSVMAHEGGVREIAVAESDFVLSLGNDQMVRLWRTAEFDEAWSMPSSGHGASSAFDPTTNSFVWFEQSMNLLATLQVVPNVIGYAAPVPSIGTVAFSDLDPVSRQALVADESQVWLVDFDSLQPVSAGSSEETLGGVFLVPDSSTYALSREIQKPTPNDPVYRWNVEMRELSDGSLIRTFTGHEDLVSDLVFSSDGDVLFSASGMYYGVDLNTDPPTFHNNPPSPDPSVRVWNANTGVQTNRIVFDEPVERLALSSDNRFLAAAAGTHVHVIDTETMEIIVRLEGPAYRLSAVSFSPDGQAIYAGTFTGFLYAWEVGEHLYESE